MDFTKAEKERINQLYGNDFKDIKPDDALLIARWEQFKAENDANFNEMTRAIQEETRARLEECKKTSDLARENLKELHDLAKARYARFENGA